MEDKVVGGCVAQMKSLETSTFLVLAVPASCSGLHSLQDSRMIDTVKARVVIKL
jgi:hypothetical protein